VFSQYPVSSALVTLLAVGVFFWLRRTRGLGDTKRSVLFAFLVLLAWLIAIPIFGVIFDGLGGIMKFVFFLYSKFEQQPIWVVILLAISIAFYFAWGKIWRQAPHPVIRAIVIAVGFVVVVSLSVPILNAISSDEPSPKPPVESTE
jgi:MFS superfamily sulfate permease-like transporter